MKQTVNYFKEMIDHHMEQYERERFYWKSGEAKVAQMHLNLADYYVVKLLKYEKRWNRYKTFIAKAPQAHAPSGECEGKTGEK